MKHLLLLCVLAAFTPGCGCTTVDPGNRGVQVTMGEVNPTPLGEGFHWVNVVSSVTEVSVRQNTAETKADTFSSDLQHVEVNLKVLYRVPEASVVPIFQKYAGNPFDTLITPRVQESLKEVTAVLTAEQIAKSREEVKQQALALTRKKVGEILVIEDLVIENVTLSPELQRAIEAKMVQQQEAAKAEFTKQKAAIEAETAVVRAKGEAEAFRIRGDALRANPKVIEMQMVEKWDGKAPLVVGGNSNGSNMILPLDIKDAAR